MTDDFDRASFERHITAAGIPPDRAAACAALFEEHVVGTLATRTHVAEIKAEIAGLRAELAAGAEAIVETQRTFSNSVRKMNYFAYLENLQFMAVMAGLAVVAAIGLAILARLW